jgi:hypothetical protein
VNRIKLVPGILGLSMALGVPILLAGPADKALGDPNRLVTKLLGQLLLWVFAGSHPGACYLLGKATSSFYWIAPSGMAIGAMGPGASRRIHSFDPGLDGVAQPDGYASKLRKRLRKACRIAALVSGFCRGDRRRDGRDALSRLRCRAPGIADKKLLVGRSNLGGCIYACTFARMGLGANTDLFDFKRHGHAVLRLAT